MSGDGIRGEPAREEVERLERSAEQLIERIAFAGSAATMPHGSMKKVAEWLTGAQPLIDALRKDINLLRTLPAQQTVQQRAIAYYEQVCREHGIPVYVEWQDEAPPIASTARAARTTTRPNRETAMAERDGGPAFPGASWESGDRMEEPGMTLRDYFAGQALVGFGANPNNLTHGLTEGGSAGEQIARAAYIIADAMLAAQHR